MLLVVICIAVDSSFAQLPFDLLFQRTVKTCHTYTFQPMLTLENDMRVRHVENIKATAWL